MNSDGFLLMDRLERVTGEEKTRLIDRISRAAAYARAEQRAEVIAYKIAEADAKFKAKK
jgi:hypothetical protein